MKATEQTKQVADERATGYFLNDLERSAVKIMDLPDKMAPNDLSPGQKAETGSAQHQCLPAFQCNSHIKGIAK